MNTSSPTAEIKALVAENRTSDALSRLLELSESNKQVHDAILILSGEFSDLTSQQLKGTIDNTEATRRRNIVHDKILIALGAFDSRGRVVPGSGVVAKSSATKILGRLTLVVWGGSLIIYLLAKVTKSERFELIVLFDYCFFTFMAYLLAVIISAFKK